MTEGPPEYDYVDYRLIQFPSDRLDLGTIRRAHPEFFDVEDAEFERALEYPDDSDGPGIRSMLYLERLLALNAYEEGHQVFTRANHVSPAEKPGFIEELTGYYIQYGLASGPQHAAANPGPRSSGRQPSSGR